MKITTFTLMKSLKTISNFNEYLERYNNQLIDISLHIYLQRLAEEKGVALATIAAKSGLGDYVYKLWNGKRQPTRSGVISIAFAMGLSLEETQRLLRTGGFAGLDPRRLRNSALIFSLEKGYSVMEANELLDEIGEKLL